MQCKVSAVQSMLFNGLLQPPVPKAGLGQLCYFAVGNISPHPTGKSKAFKFFFRVFYYNFAFFEPGILQSRQVWPELLCIASD